MREKRIGLIIMVLVLLMGTLVGCGEKKEEVSDYYIYYLDKDETKTVAVGYTPKATDAKGMVDELLKELSKPGDSLNYKNPIPEGVRVDFWKLDNTQLYLHFNRGYSEMDNISEVLCRAAIVRTLTQIEEVECVSFYVGDFPLMDVNGNPIGLMTAESFVENPGAQINVILCSDITLYFSNKEGTKLVPEVQEVHYSSNISMEKLIIEHLLKGPKSKELRPAIPKDTKLVNVSVLDGVCYVNLDEGFMEQNYEVAEPIVIYSIVNSLVELPGVNKVQITVNGEDNKIYRDSYALGVIYERNLDYLDASKTKEDQEEQEKEMEEMGD